MMRKLSWLFFVLAIVAVPLYASWALDRDAAAQRAAHAWACGLVAMGIVFFSVAIGVLLSGLAGTLGFLSFRKLPAPRSRRRQAELLVLFAPCVGGLVFMVLALLLP
jgi:hypothetical protein